MATQCSLKSSLIAVFFILCSASAQGDISVPKNTIIKFWNHTRNTYTATLFLAIDETSEVAQTIFLKQFARENRTFDKNHVQFLSLVIENEHKKQYIIDDPFLNTECNDCTVHIYEDRVEIR